MITNFQKGLLKRIKKLRSKTFRPKDPKYKIGGKWKYDPSSEVEFSDIEKNVSKYRDTAKEGYEKGGITKKQYGFMEKVGDKQISQLDKRKKAKSHYLTKDQVNRDFINTYADKEDTKALSKYGKHDPGIIDTHEAHGIFSLDHKTGKKPVVIYADKNRPSTMLHELDHMKDYAKRRHTPNTNEVGAFQSRQLPTDTVIEGATTPKGLGHHSWKTGHSEEKAAEHLYSGGSTINYMNLPKVVKGAHERFDEDQKKYLRRKKNRVQYQTKYGKKLYESVADTRMMKDDVKDLVDIQGKKEPWEKVPYHKMSDIRVKGIRYKEDPKPIKKSLKRLNLM